MTDFDDIMDRLDAEPKSIWWKIERAYWNFHHWIGFSSIWRFKPRFIWQHITRGFPDHHLWNLDYRFSKFIAPRMRTFADYPLHGYPSGYTGKYGDETTVAFMHWKRDVKKLAYAFEKLAENSQDWIDASEFFKRKMSEEEKERWFKVMEVRRKFIDDNLAFFGKHYRSFWD